MRASRVSPGKDLLSSVLLSQDLSKSVLEAKFAFESCERRFHSFSIKRGRPIAFMDISKKTLGGDPKDDSHVLKRPPLDLFHLLQSVA